MSIEVFNPATGQLIKSYPTLTKNNMLQVIDQVAQAQRDWQSTSHAERRALMQKVATLLRDENEKYATIITQEMGKPISQAKGEIEKCAWLAEYYAENAEKFLQPEIIETAMQKTYRSIKPLGIIFAIMPWNFPFWQVLRFAIPNMMGGNAALLKHAPNSTGAALAIEQLFRDAGFPPHLFRSLVIDVELAADVIAHPEVAGVTITGSGRAGQAVAQEAGKHLKKVVLELGGSDPYLILEDADVDHAVQQCITSRLNNAGQICISAKRIIITAPLYDEFCQKVQTAMEKYHSGDPMDPETNLGPMARDDLRMELHKQVEKSIAEGARCVMGGQLPQSEGYFYPATLLLDVTSEMTPAKEELFGPVVSLFKVNDQAEAIQLANDSPFGLGAAVFTKDIAKGEHIARDLLHAGTCNVNTFVGSDPRVPFGGIKQSGYGRELAVEGMREFMNVKSVNIL